MKELSIEEKAKRYDEAIEIAEEINNEQLAQPFDVMTRVFPELKDKESEDERIRKELITFFQRFPYERIGNAGTKVKEAIDWLEKQCEQKSVDDLTQQEAMDIAVAKCFNEQKHADTENGAKGNEVEIPISEPPLTIEHAREVMGIKQKHAWSEEDEAVLDALIRRLEGEDVYVSPHLAAECLKSIKDRVQPKQEWSEEDEANLNEALSYIKDDALKEFIKSLRPQSQWKPSDEQMNALNYVVNLMASSERPTENDLYYNILKSLRQQLKKHYL